VGKRWKSLSTRSGLYGGCSKIVHLKCCKSCCVAVLTWGQALLWRSRTPVVSSPGHCHLMAARNHSMVAQYDAALIVAPLSMKSINSTPLQSRSTITITLPTDSPILNFFYCKDPGCFHSILARFVLSPVTVCLRKLWPWMAYYRRNESSLNILCTVWSSESAHGSNHAQTLWKPTFWIILTVVQCERPKQCSSSLSHSSVIQDYCLNTCFVLKGLLLFVCHFSHCPMSQFDQIGSLNTILPHCDDSPPLPHKLRLADDECQLQKHAYHAKYKLQHGPPLWATVLVEP